jgi:DNA invertase Pin-like site-specific DNA recombinase
MMGKYFNEHFMHAKVWPRRTLKDMLADVHNRREARNPTKHAGGRPALDIAPNEVYDALHEGQTVTEVAKKFGISRASVYKLTEGM